MKKLLVALLALVSLAVVAAGCGGGEKNVADGKTVVKVGATAVPHAEILNHIKGSLAQYVPCLQKSEAFCARWQRFPDKVHVGRSLHPALYHSGTDWVLHSR